MDSLTRQHRKAQDAERIIKAIRPALGQLTAAQNTLRRMNAPAGMTMALFRAAAEMDRAIHMALKGQQRASRKAVRLAAKDTAAIEAANATNHGSALPTKESA